MTTTMPESPAADHAVYRFLCHGCGRRLRLARSNAGGELRCPGCAMRLCAPPPAGEETGELPVSTPAPAIRRKPPQVSANRSGLLTEQGATFPLQGEDAFERSLDAMAALSNTPFPAVNALSIHPFGETPAVPTPEPVPAKAAAPAQPNPHHLWHVVAGTGIGLAAGLVAGLMLALLIAKNAH
jgi:hypothetical protein